MSILLYIMHARLQEYHKPHYLAPMAFEFKNARSHVANNGQNRLYYSSLSVITFCWYIEINVKYCCHSISIIK